MCRSSTSELRWLVLRCGVGLAHVREGGSLRRGEWVRGHLTCTPAGRSGFVPEQISPVVLGDQHEPAFERLFAAEDDPFGKSFLNDFFANYRVRHVTNFDSTEISHMRAESVILL